MLRWPTTAAMHYASCWQQHDDRHARSIAQQLLEQQTGKDESTDEQDTAKARRTTAFGN